MTRDHIDSAPSVLRLNVELAHIGRMPRPSRLKTTLAILRKELGLGQKEMADKLRWPISRLKEAENDRRPLTEALALQVSQRFNVSVKWLLDGDSKGIRDRQGRPYKKENQSNVDFPINIDELARDNCLWATLLYDLLVSAHATGYREWADRRLQAVYTELRALIDQSVAPGVGRPPLPQQPIAWTTTGKRSELTGTEVAILELIAQGFTGKSMTVINDTDDELKGRAEKMTEERLADTDTRVAMSPRDNVLRLGGDIGRAILTDSLFSTLKAVRMLVRANRQP